jgi:transposase
MSRHSTTAGIDIGDKHSHLYLLDTQSGEVIEEGKGRTSPEAFERCFSRGERMQVAIEAGTHSPWISRLLERLGHDGPGGPDARKLRLIYGEGKKNDKLDAENLARAGRGRTRSCSLR